MENSAIYEGTIRHRRTAEKDHAFTYRVAMTYLDLSEIETALDGRLAKPGFGPLRFRRSDFYGDPSIPLDDAIRAFAGTEGPVRLLTHLRSFGHCFNPASFYYCFAADGTTLEAVVAEVTNTPWGEKRAYVMPRNARGQLGGSFAKKLHVSPFFGMDQTYSWRAREPDDSLFLHMENNEAGKRVFDATLRLERKPLDARTVRRISLRYPAASRRMLVLIYAHAVLLKLKGVKVKPHPGAVTQ